MSHPPASGTPVGELMRGRPILGKLIRQDLSTKLPAMSVFNPVVQGLASDMLVIEVVDKGDSNNAQK
jgi:hypothetical protein